MTKTRKQRPLKLKREHNLDLKEFVIELLQKTWSPAQIAGYLKMKLGYCSISHEAIYRYIFSEEGKKLGLYKYLRSRKKQRIKFISRKNKTLLNRKSIHERPAYIDDRSDFGHWEADLMAFKRNNKCNLLTLRERQTRYVMVIKNYSKTAQEIRRHIEYLFSIQSSYLPLKSITVDNGKEWAEHEQISKKFGINLYFCDPYKPYQKGSIENANFFLREFFPREIPIDQLSDEYIDSKVNLLNRRPMRCLGYLAPEQLFWEKVKQTG
ncbi:MAG: putative transposase-related protein [Francisellaceae bacterium]|nr:putative transposase-related protein [Francisellaceae bacterium]